MSDLRPTAFLIASEDGFFLCPVCGWGGTFKGNHFHDDEGGCIATGICACCAYEPGFDDNPLASNEAKTTLAESIAVRRRSWIDMGSPWRGIDATPRPQNWSAQAQLSRLFKRAPFLAG